MSNFQFLSPEFRTLQEPAAGAEQLVQVDPRAACMRARHALEQVVLWLYDNDSSLRLPVHDTALNTLMNQIEFRRLVPPYVLDKMHLLRQAGNVAVHGGKQMVQRSDAMALVQELFHTLFWLARTYTRTSDPKQMHADWDSQQVPLLVNAQQAAAEFAQVTKAELKKQEAKFQAQLEQQRQELAAREAQLSAQAATQAERESLLARLDTELAQRQAELASAKAAAIAVDDSHDYNEAETRKRLIDVRLREAGWTFKAADAPPTDKTDKTLYNASVELPVPGMPNQAGEGFADYVLWGQDGKPVAVVEAKRSLKDAEVGRQQAKLYADGLEKHYGQRPLIFYTNGHRTYLWDDLQYPPREVQGFYTQSELALAMERRHSRQSLAAQPIKAEIVERPYQQRAIRAITEAFTQGQRRALLTMATGTGKTRVAVALTDVLMRANWAKRILFLADRVSLVNQATNKGFKPLLANASPVNLLHDKSGQGRVYLSTYPTMMGLIDQIKDDGTRQFGVGHFDMVIIDEAHRSVYQKYGAIFKYFDSLLVGLTATPRDEVDRDTYHLFGLEKGVPTDAYGMNEAVTQGHLVPPKSFSVPLKFVRQGIKYEQLSAEEKEHWESIDWGDDGPPDEVGASEINKFLFNEDTVDKMLKHLMEHGLKVDGGDRLGKTIIFAVNQKHADFIAARFDHHYPHLKGSFAQVITHAASYAQTLIDDFSKSTSAPHIAISVDMLDTGIDVPEVLNLVFFKAVRSKVKFLQMIGRGTRLCLNLFGPGQHKSEFYIFDYCQNFEYFNENPAGASGSVAEPLGKRLFKARLDLLTLLRTPQQTPAAHSVQEKPPVYTHAADLQTALTDELHAEVAAMNPDNFIVRTELDHVQRFAERERWGRLDEADVGQLRNHVAGLPSQRESDHITARLFDLQCVNLQLALLNKEKRFGKLREQVIEIAGRLEVLANVPAVQAEMALIQEVQTEGYWVGITAPIIEHLRRHLRGLIKFIEKQAGTTIYTVLDDQIGEATEVTLKDFSTGINMVQYRKKVEAFIRANANHLAIAKLRLNKPLTPTDLSELERFVYEAPEVEGRERFSETFGEKSLPQFIRSLVGMDRAAAQQAFSQFLDQSRYSSQQIRFVEMIIERLTAHGEIQVSQLYEPPFTAVHSQGLDGTFTNSKDADALVEAVDEMQRLTA